MAHGRGRRNITQVGSTRASGRARGNRAEAHSRNAPGPSLGQASSRGALAGDLARQAAQGSLRSWRRTQPGPRPLERGQPARDRDSAAFAYLSPYHVASCALSRALSGQLDPVARPRRHRMDQQGQSGVRRVDQPAGTPPASAAVPPGHWNASVAVSGLGATIADGSDPTPQEALAGFDTYHAVGNGSPIAPEAHLDLLAGLRSDVHRHQQCRAG